MRKILAVAVVFIVGIACGLVLTYGPMHSQVFAGESDVLAKLDEISKAQQEMKVIINAVREDLQVLKVRITQMQ